MIFRAAPIRDTQPIPYETARTFARAFRKLFATPRFARQLFIADATKRGIDRATVTLQLNPERFGELRTGASGTHRRDAVDAAYEFAYAYHDFWRERLLEEAPLLYEANAALAAHHVVSIVTEYSRAAEELVLELTDRRRHARAVIREFIMRFLNVYGWDRRPLRALRKHYRSLGMDATLAALRRSPGTFGPYRKSEIEVGHIWLRRPLFSYVTDANARAAARGLPELFMRAAEAYSGRPTPADIARAQTREREGQASLVEATAVAKHYRRSVDEYIGECALGILRFTEARPEPPARWEALVTDLAPMLPPAALSLARQSAIRRRNAGG
jgi:hypothetical protein